MIHFSGINTSPRLGDLKPGKMLEAFVGAFQAFGDGVLHRHFRGARDLNDFVNGIFHEIG